MKSKFCYLASLIACAALLVSISSAQDASKQVAPTGRIEAFSAIERTPEQMDAFDATSAVAGINRQAPFRPTIDETQYLQLKQNAGLAPHFAKPSSLAPEQLAAVKAEFGGATQCDGPGGCWIPPDVSGAIGKSQFVSGSNNVFEVRSRTGVLLKTNSLNGLCGYSGESFTDPRVQYDEIWQRWVITAVAFVQPITGGTQQIFCVAASKTNSATGAFWVYLIDVTFITGGGTNSFYDYDMLGMTRDALLFTSNVFGQTTFRGDSLFSWPKAYVYNGFGFGYNFYTGLAATLQPAHQVLSDGNPCAWLAAAVGSGAIDMYKLCNPGNEGTQSLNFYTVSGVPAFSLPPPAAPQPSSCETTNTALDSLDGRFQNVGTQNGDSFYQVNSVNIGGGFPAPRYYVISGLLSSAPTVSLSNLVFASGSSYDFNPSIAADPSGHFALNWSYTDPATGTEASERFADNNGGNPGPGSGLTVFTSASCYNSPVNGTSRWGDYSQVSLDPGTGVQSSTTSKTFWIDNETIPGLDFWSTEIAKVAY